MFMWRQMIMYESYDDIYNGTEKGFGSCGGIIKMVDGMKIKKDRVFYLRLFNKKHVKSHESIMYAESLDAAEQQYTINLELLPRHFYHEISDYALDNSRIPIDNGVIQ